MGRRACVWLVTAKEVEHFAVGFVKAARQALAVFYGFYPVLYNYIDVSYPQAGRFARLLGGRAQTEIKQAGGKDFQLFLFRRESLWEEQ